MKVKVSRVGDNGKKLHLPKAIWASMGLEVGDTIEFIVSKTGKVSIVKVKEDKK